MAAAQPAPFRDELCNTAIIQDAELRALVDAVNARQPAVNFNDTELKHILVHFALDKITRGKRWPLYSSELVVYLRTITNIARSRKNSEAHQQRLQIDPEYKAHFIASGKVKNIRKRARMDTDAVYREQQNAVYHARESERKRMKAEHPDEFEELWTQVKELRRTSAYIARQLTDTENAAAKREKRLTARRDKYAAEPEKYRDYGRKSYYLHKNDTEGWAANLRSPWYSVRNRAAELGMALTLTRPQVEALVLLSCYYCSTIAKRRGIDRKDSCLGYHENNCVSACRQCNMSKGTNSVGTFIALAHDVVKHADDPTFVSTLTHSATTKRSFTMWSNAHKNGHSSSITEEQWAATLVCNCTYCGRVKCNGIDRINSLSNYDVGNIQPCCKTCNYLKHTCNHDEFLAKMRAIVATHPVKPEDVPMAVDRMVRPGQLEQGNGRSTRKCDDCGLLRKVSRFFDVDSNTCSRCLKKSVECDDNALINI